MKHAIQHIHFIGIGGSGMSGIAEVLFYQGYTVSGSDLTDSATLRRLKDIGITTYIGHSANNLVDVHAVVTSTAVPSDNPEILLARQQHIPIVPRAVMLAELMRSKHGIAIAGTHGKTTTTSLVASILGQAKLDPTFVIGGRLNSVGSNAKLGTGQYIVVEADESDASFLNLLPLMTVVTNIDADHMDTYGHDFGRLKNAFVDFLNKMPFYGTAVLCTDDPTLSDIANTLARPVTSYGFNEQAQVRAINVRAVHTQMHFTVLRRNGVILLPDLDVVLNLPGRHNVLNALSAIAIATELDIADDDIVTALEQFRGVGRRFQNYGQVPSKDGGTFTLIDDYGHHPVEMAATLAAARGAYPTQRLILAFQPHRYTRTRDCFEDFVKVLNEADMVLISEVYAAGESPIVAADGRALVRALRVAAHVDPLFIDDIRSMPTAVLDHARNGDVVICMGAGSMGGVSARITQLAGLS